MNKQDVIEFFDCCAANWDSEQEDRSSVINTILDNAGVKSGTKILDVACGTGILMDYYLERNAGSVLGVDISGEMIRRAREKFNDDRISFLCTDAEELYCENCFDCVIVYNAFPHFPQPDRLIEKLSRYVKRGGTVTVAHGMSREAIDRHHLGCARKVSNGLMSAEDLSCIFKKYLELTAVISNDEMYQVAGCKK